jgi:transcriptional regulator with XRE-family HTH domain
LTSEPPPYPGLLLHRARIAAGVKLRAAARAAGCSHTLLSLIETGKRRICLADGRLDLEALLLVLHATPELRVALQRAEPVEMVGMRDCFGESGEPQELIEKFGMGVGAVVEAIKRAINRKAVSR